MTATPISGSWWCENEFCPVRLEAVASTFGEYIRLYMEAAWQVSSMRKISWYLATGVSGSHRKKEGGGGGGNLFFANI